MNQMFRCPMCLSGMQEQFLTEHFHRCSEAPIVVRSLAEVQLHKEPERKRCGQCHKLNRRRVLEKRCPECAVELVRSIFIHLMAKEVEV